MNILITGSLSHLGINFINLFHKSYNKLILIDRISYCSNDLTNDIFNKDNIINIYNDINDVNIENLLNFYKIDIILHCAASTHIDRSYIKFDEFINDNIIATTKLLNSVKSYGKLKKFIHISTDEIYGGSDTKVFNEKSVFNPTNPYAGSKAAIEMIINSYIYTYKLPIIIIRPNNLFGKYQYSEKVIPKFIKSIINNKSVTIHGNGNQVRDFIFVEDVCKALQYIILNVHTINKNSKSEIVISDYIYNVGIHNPININTLAYKIFNYLKERNLTKLTKDNYCDYVKDRPYNDKRYILETSKLTEIGFNIQNNWDKNLSETINWCVNN